jgi:uncharacterized protein YdhG (YjbR/CyaY superfamily)
MVVCSIREAFRGMVPEAKEAISYGIPSFGSARMIAVINPAKKGITLTFFRGRVLG